MVSLLQPILCPRLFTYKRIYLYQASGVTKIPRRYFGPKGILTGSYILTLLSLNLAK